MKLAIEAGPFVRYAKGIQRLSRQWRTHPDYSCALSCTKSRCALRSDQAMRFGDTPIITADINRIIDGLSHFDPPLFSEGATSLITARVSKPAQQTVLRLARRRSLPLNLLVVRHAC